MYCCRSTFPLRQLLQLGWVGLLVPFAFAQTADPMGNPLLQPSSLPYGYPAFDQIRDEHFAPAFEAAMARELEEVQAITQQPGRPTFENTIVALERSGQLFAQVERIFSNLDSADTNPARQALDREFAPRFAAHRDEIRLNPDLFARIRAIYDQRESLDLDSEAQRLVVRTYEEFVRAGAELDEAGKTRLKVLNAELARLQTTFTQNVLAEVNASAVLVSDRARLDGLTEAAIASAADAATAAGKPGQFLIRLQNTTTQPVLATLRDRSLREEIFRASIARGSRGGEFDNRTVVIQMVQLRAERAALLGFANHAAFVLADQTAKSTGAVDRLLQQLAGPAVANAKKEAADLQAIAAREGGGFALQPWDWAYYAEQLRRERFAFDDEELKPYLELDRVLVDGVFYAAQQLFGLRFEERRDLPVYHPDVRVWEVFEENGTAIGLFLGDFYARPSKRGGAWMSDYVPQTLLLGLRPVIANHLNVQKPPAGQPTLLSYDEANTLFHEFGHALHGLLSSVTYPRFSGTNVPRDFVEFPSQVNEMWLEWPEVRANFARHYQTNQPIPAELLQKVQAAEKFNQGYLTTEYLAAALLDQAWHQLDRKAVPAPEAVLDFEAQALARANVAFPLVPPRYRTPYFSHTFAGGYSAGYYSYIWSEVLDADAVEWFKQNGGLSREAGEHYRRTILSRGGSADAMDLYRAFRGADPKIEPLLQRRGLE